MSLHPLQLTHGYSYLRILNKILNSLDIAVIGIYTWHLLFHDELTQIVQYCQSRFMCYKYSKGAPVFIQQGRTHQLPWVQSIWCLFETINRFVNLGLQNSHDILYTQMRTFQLTFNLRRKYFNKFTFNAQLNMWPIPNFY